MLPHATFLGTLTGSALAVAYASSDVFLYPSTTEGWGATCLEAQATVTASVYIISYSFRDCFRDCFRYSSRYSSR